MTGQTVTQVHSSEAEQAARWIARAKEQSALSAFGVFAQMFIGMSLYLYANVGTPGFLSILLSIPYTLLLLLAAKALAKRGILREAFFGKRKNAARILFLQAGCLSLLDAFLIFLSLCAVLREIMPSDSLTGMALAAALFTALGIGKGKKDGLLHLARFLTFLLLALLLFCVVSAYPFGRADYLFPLLGYGAQPIWKGGAWMCGCVSGCVWPLLTAESESLERMTGRKSVLLRPLAFAYALALLCMLAACWLMPIHAMQRPETLGWRMLLLTNMTPSIPAWSMQVAGVLLLLLLALHDRTLIAARAVSRFVKTEKGGFLIPLVLLLLMVPLAASPSSAWVDGIVSLSALRAVLMPGMLLLSFLIGRKPKKEEAE